MGDGDSPVGLSVISFKGMRSWLDKLLLWALILSIALQNAAVDCKRVEINELPSPNLNSSINVVRMGQNVSLSCSTKNTSVDITYSLFWGTKYLESKRRRGGAVDFQLSISNVNKTGPYKCKINVYNVSNVSNSSKYSQDFNFTIARKTLRENESKGSEDAPTQSELYANVCKTQTGAEQPQEIHYAIPVFKESAPTEQEGSMDRKADYFYSELTY
ncbi:allergin-1 isoform X2 [Mastomys coucha]|uniref:allergin-1 isoform X2 n=1 Tax=Mastomys coucha TaxID=35658 RepID=UPI0012613B4A|nr:allergin-1 isoform X2 [Mastomys coucha]